MVRFLTLQLFMLQLVFSSDTESKLYGVWRSDACLTNAHLVRNAKLSEYQKKVFEGFFGLTFLTFNADGTSTVRTKQLVIPKKDGGEQLLPATETNFTFKILGETDSQLVIETTSGDFTFGEHPFAILKFEELDIYSVSLSDGVADLNGREFFIRQKTEKISETTR